MYTVDVSKQSPPFPSTRLALVPRRSLSPYMCKPATYEEQGSYMCSRATFIQPANLPQTCLAGRLVRTTISRYVVVGLLAEMDEFICFLWHKLNAFPPHSLFPPTTLLPPPSSLAVFQEARRARSVFVCHVFKPPYFDIPRAFYEGSRM